MEYIKNYESDEEQDTNMQVPEKEVCTLNGFVIVVCLLVLYVVKDYFVLIMTAESTIK